MQIYLIAGNIFSFLSALCIAISVVKKNKTDLIYWQILDTLFCILASAFLFAYASLVTNSIALVRNVLAYKGKLSNIYTFVLCLVVILVGIYVNNIGIYGILPIAAMVVYTFYLYAAKNEQQMRYAVVINLMLWCIHDFYVKAYPSAVTDILLSLWTVLQIFRYCSTQRAASL